MKICLQCHHHFNQTNWNCPACGYIPPYVEEYLTFAPELAAKSEGFEVEFFPQLAKLEAKNFLNLKWFFFHLFQLRLFVGSVCGRLRCILFLMLPPCPIIYSTQSSFVSL